MSVQITLEYLAKLLNKPVTEQMDITLSSAQKSRLYGWLVKNGIAFNEAALAKKFSVNQLIGGLDSGESLYKTPPQETFSSPIQLSMRNFQIGVDIQRVDELFPRGLSFDPKADHELTQIFTAKELSYAQSKDDPETTLAGIFSAKEAIQKACNADMALNMIEILPDENGRPKSNGYALSISHSGNYAIALALNASICDGFAFEAQNTSDNSKIIKNEVGLSSRKLFYVSWSISLIILGLLNVFLIIYLFRR